MDAHLAVVESFLALSQALEINPDAYVGVFHPEGEQVEYPNMLTRSTQRRTLEEVLANVRAGRELLHGTKFEQTRLRACPDGTVVVETYWQAYATNDFNQMVRGGRIAAHICMVFEFRDNLIIRQSSYRCYEPFAD
jgi:hypothetical protein